MKHVWIVKVKFEGDKNHEVLAIRWKDTIPVGKDYQISFSYMSFLTKKAAQIAIKWHRECYPGCEYHIVKMVREA